jgi:hypothetical protein
MPHEEVHYKDEYNDKTDFEPRNRQLRLGERGFWRKIDRRNEDIEYERSRLEDNDPDGSDLASHIKWLDSI